MLTLLKRQALRFQEAQGFRFEDEAVEHVKKFFEKHYRVHGEKRIREVVGFAVRRAGVYKLTTERSICLYLDMMLIAGSNFDTDVQLPWVGEILNDPTIVEQEARIDLLVDEVMTFTRMAHSHGIYLNKALLEVCRDDLFRIVTDPPAMDGFEPAMATHFRRLFPRKCEALGSRNLQCGIQHSLRTAPTYGITAPHGLAAYSLLTFLLGSGFDDDPQLPWASETLRSAHVNSDRINNEREKATTLQHRCLEYWERRI